MFAFVLMNQAVTHAFSWEVVIFVAYKEILLHITLYLLSFSLKELSISLLQESEFVRVSSDPLFIFLAICHLPVAFKYQTYCSSFLCNLSVVFFLY